MQPSINAKSTAEPTHGSEAIYGIEKVNGVYCVRTDAGDAIPIKTEAGALLGHPATFSEGWEPQFIYAGFAPLYCLEWKHQSGSAGTWYLNTEMRVVGGPGKEPPPELRATIRQSGSALITKLWDQILCRPLPALDDNARSLQRLNPQTISHLVDICVPELSVEFPITDLNTVRGKEQIFTIFSGSQLAEVRSSFILDILDDKAEFAGKTLADFPNGRFTWPSPVTGELLSTDAIICLGITIFAYRLIEPLLDLVFYVVTSGDKNRPLGLFFPASGQIFCANPNEFRHRIPGLRRIFRHHACAYAADLEGYLRAPSRILTCLIHGHHHGHLLFEDLAGIDDVVHRLPPDQLPEIFLRAPGEVSEAAESYGKIEDLFPVLKGKVQRFPGWIALLRHAYRQRRSLQRAAPQYVRRRLADRIIAFSSTGPAMVTEKQRLDALVAKEWPIVLIDLRIENRTLTDLPGFCARLIEFLLAQTGGVAVVMCGHTGSYVSPVDKAAEKPPTEAQRDIVADLVRRFKGSDVEIIDTIGKGMLCAVFWSAHAHVFVAPWGASLVVYRWISNKPGIILANKYNQTHGRGPDSDIYKSPAIMESPRLMEFLPPEYIEDDPSAMPLSSYTHPGQPPESFYNFRVNEAVTFSRIRKLLSEYGPSAFRPKPTSSADRS